MKYKKGDKVIVRKDLKVGESYGVYFNDDMSNFIGKEVTIDCVGSLDYRIKEDNLSWSWTDKMFEDFKYNYKKGTKLRRINDHGKYFNIGTIITLSKDILSNDMYENVYCEEIKESVGIIYNYEEVKEEELEKKYDFKVGDLVKLKKGYIGMLHPSDKEITFKIKEIGDYLKIVELNKISNIEFYIAPKRCFEKEDRILSVSTPLGSPVIDDLLKITFDAKRIDDEIHNTLVKGGKTMTDIETLKTFNPKNLSEGKRQAEEEKANYEASESKKAYTALINQKEELERIIKTTNEELKKVKESLAVFK